MKITNSMKGILAGAVIAVSASGAQAASYNYLGTIDSCTGICGIFTAVGQSLDLSFDSVAAGPGQILTADVSNVAIALSTPSGGALAFVSGFAVSSALDIDGGDAVTGGIATFQATGATTGIVAQAAIDVDTGLWEAFVVETNGSLTSIAAGNGAFVSAVPVPAAAWLFGTALVGLAGIGRQRKA
jgi:hypothetical protein